MAIVNRPDERPKAWRADCARIYRGGLERRLLRERKRHQIADPDGRSQGKGARAVARHGMKIERNPHANHLDKVLPTFEEPPAVRE